MSVDLPCFDCLNSQSEPLSGEPLHNKFSKHIPLLRDASFILSDSSQDKWGTTEGQEETAEIRCGQVLTTR